MRLQSHLPVPALHGPAGMSRAAVRRFGVWRGAPLSGRGKRPMAGADTGGVRCVGIDGNGAKRLNSQRCGLPGDVAHGLENARSTARVAGLAFGLGGVRDRHGGASNQGGEQGEAMIPCWGHNGPGTWRNFAPMVNQPHLCAAPVAFFSPP